MYLFQARKEALLKKYADRDTKLQALRREGRAKSATPFAFGSSTTRMHVSMLDVSARARSHANLSARPASAADVHPAPGTTCTSCLCNPMQYIHRQFSTVYTRAYLSLKVKFGIFS